MKLLNMTLEQAIEISKSGYENVDNELYLQANSLLAVEQARLYNKQSNKDIFNTENILGVHYEQKR